MTLGSVDTATAATAFPASSASRRRSDGAEDITAYGGWRAYLARDRR